MELKTLKVLLIILGLVFNLNNLMSQENAAPSLHLTINYTNKDAMLIMQKIKIVQSAYASYFEVNKFTNGYCGLQQTPDRLYSNSNILISSLWDVNTAAEIYSNVEYHDITTVTSRFGGEGDGCKTINPYTWSLNTWYNIVNRAWKSNGKLFIATFINDMATNKWFHTATLSIPFGGKYLGSYNDAFLENWDGYNKLYNGAFVRKAFFKDNWKLNIKGNWEKNPSARFSANNSIADSVRNGIYHNSFNTGFDVNEDAYFMQHGGNTTRSADFNGGRILNLPAQSKQASSPSLFNGAITSATATYNNGATNINWTVDDFKSPQLAAKVEILDVFGKIIDSYQDTLPQRRNYSSTVNLQPGNYQARVTMIDVFNQTSPSVTANFVVPGNYLSVSTDSIALASAANSSKTFDLASNSSWTATSNETWLSLSNNTGTDNATIILTAQENLTNTTRMATVTISGAGFTDQTITVTQDPRLTGINEINDRSDVFGLNVVSGELTINRIHPNTVLSIYDLKGSLIINKKARSTTENIDISSLKNGIYYIKVTDKNVIKTTNFLMK